MTEEQSASIEQEAAHQTWPVIAEEPAVELNASRFIIRSERIGREFQVTVSRPIAKPFLAGQTFPVIYALDNGYGLAGPLATLLGSAGAMSPAIVVSVGYPPSQQWKFRSTDLLHNSLTLDDAVIGGGGAAFQAFLLDDLKPFIDHRFPADPARTVLVGHSYGGLFTANVLASDPAAFSAYVIGSPSVHADPGVVQRVMRAKVKGGRVFLAVGSHDDVFHVRKTPMLTGFARLRTALQRHLDITLKTHIFADEAHLSNYAKLIGDAFPFVVPPPLNLAEPLEHISWRMFAPYLGVYTLPDGREVTITGAPYPAPTIDLMFRVTAQVTDLPPTPLFHVGGSRFYDPSADVDILFDKTGFTLSGGGAAGRAERKSIGTAAAEVTEPADT